MTERGGRVRRLWRSVGFGALVVLSAVACSGNFDTTRQARPYASKSTLGQEVFGVLCDRVGAGALAEDPMGLSFHAVCHPDGAGKYADTVDQAKLPPVSGAAAVTRNLAVAKVEVLARRRAELIKAIDVILPDIEYDDPYATPPRKVRLHEAVRVLIQRLNPLYDSNPLASEGASSDPLLPSATQSLARLFQTLADSAPAQQALSQIGGRKGYRPLSVGLGAIAPILTYPNLRAISQQSVRILSPGGPARAEFVQLLNVVHEELRTSETQVPLSPILVDDSIAQPNRPRDNLEILSNVLLATDPSFEGEAMHMGLIVQRDDRGFAMVTGSAPGFPGSIPAPFVDNDGDGLADVDLFGRFVDAQGNPVQVDLPFSVPGEPRVRAPDALGRAVLDNGEPAYAYIDTNTTLVASLLRDVTNLVDPDPANDRETLMDALAGAYVLLGDRVPDQAMVYGDGVKFEKKTIMYKGFDPETSPLVDLVYAAGQVLGDPQSDDFLAQMIDLFENHEQELARVVGAALEMKAIADKYPDVSLPRDSIVWDQMMDVVAKIANVGPSDGSWDGPGLLEDLLLALGDDRSLALGDVYSKFATYRDIMSYDPNNLNGPGFNRTSGDYQPPHVPVDRSKPTTGTNRSALQRSLQMIYDSTTTKSCNKAGAHLNLVTNVPIVGKMSMVYPDEWIFDIACPTTKQDPIEECGVYEIPNMTVFYLQSLIEDDPNLPPSKHRHVANLVVKDKCLNGLASTLGLDMSETFQSSSSIQGLTTHPTHLALNRLVFFGADSTNYPGLPDLDPYLGSTNKTTGDFIMGLQDPISARVCPPDSHGMNLCTSKDDLLRIRNPGTLFLWEHFGFADANRPLLGAFYFHEAEQLFADAVDVLHWHYADDTHGAECNPSGNWKTNRKWCSEDGIVRYEPMLAEQLETDIVPALHALIKNVIAKQVIESRRYRARNGAPSIERRGSEVLAAMTRALTDPSYAASVHMRKRNGDKSTVWSDGTTVKPQVTPFDLFAEALRKIDDRFATAGGFSPEDRALRQARWKKARSRLVDQFLAVDGTGVNARFRNPAVPKAVVGLLKTLREQVNAHCPDRETTGQCEWARTELANKMIDSMRGPLFAAVVDLADKIQADPSRAELEKLLQYLLTVGIDDETLRAVLASAVDVIQVLRDGQTLPPIMNVLSSLSVPDNTVQADGVTPASGAADIVLQALNVLSRDPQDGESPDAPLVFDRYRVLDQILPNLVKPIDDSGTSKTALEVIVDVALDVNRVDSSQGGPLSPEDYKQVAASVKDFLVSPNRGMEQLYTVVRGREGN
jgi:hypothetical protein